jgi:hypothetical protein
MSIGICVRVAREEAQRSSSIGITVNTQHNTLIIHHHHQPCQPSSNIINIIKTHHHQHHVNIINHHRLHHPASKSEKHRYNHQSSICCVVQVALGGRPADQKKNKASTIEHTFTAPSHHQSSSSKQMSKRI